jgi:hypothetical protein
MFSWHYVSKVIYKNHTKTNVRIEMSKCKIRSTQFEIDSTELVAGRNNNKIQISQFFKHVWNFGHLIFGFV